MTVAKFWEAQRFSYLITYSFNRGPKLAALGQASRILFQQTRHELLIAPIKQLPSLRARLRCLERNNDLGMFALTEGLGAFHITATPISIIYRETVSAENLGTALRIPVQQQTNWMCAPVYRDALAFYNEQGQLISVLNICFQCEKMITDQNVEVQADTSTYQAIQSILEKLGHDTTDDVADRLKHI